MNEKRSISRISKSIHAKALQLGFAACGFSRAEELPEDAERLKDWLEKDYHGHMGYMANHFEKRCDPTLLVEGSKSVISLLYSYHTNQQQSDPKAPVISKYAYGKDYHFVLKEKMNQLFDFIKSDFGPVEGRVFVDSAPVLDRAWAKRAGLGWIGKNSNLISRSAGSFVFISEIIIDLELEYMQVPEGDFCGSCTRCIDACPTEAILTNHTLDARKCISYLTIELKDEIPEEHRPRLAQRFFGCDICQDVCPWNRQALPHSEPAFEPSPELLEMDREQWLKLDRERYTSLFKGSAVKRAGLPKIQQSIAYLDNKVKD